MKGKFPNGLKAAMERVGVKSAALARAMNTSPQNIQRWRDGERELTAGWANELALHLPGIDPAELVFADDERKPPLKTLVVGTVGAGAVYAPFDPGVIDEIDRPPWANDKTVAAEIRGDSLGSMFDRWLVFYDDVHERPTSKMMGKLCIVWLADKRVLVKKLSRGQVTGLFTLLSNFDPPIYDVAVERCALVNHMAPR